ncbi:MAG TPA: alpha/beta fold hydrolase [Chloroflexota bacterium]|nr:alpha/beta fold hydrolase [Chloroflexota bacterium]
MPLSEYPLETLRSYRPDPNAPSDLAQFWTSTLAESSRTPLNATVEKVDYPVDGLDVRRVTYDGWRGARIVGWFIARQGARAQPTLVFYHGYSGSKGQVYDYLGWAFQGYTVLAVDVRGQSGDSSDPGNYPGGHVTGWMTQGILSAETYYYRGAYVDSVRALDFAVSRSEVDPDRIGVLGVSQGGGLSLAVAALDSRPKLSMPEVPFLCHYRRAVEVSNVNPYLEIAVYCHRYPDRETQVFDTLRYFDNLSLAKNITCPILVTVGIQDLVCPPSTVFAVYNHVSSTDKELRVYPYGAHEAYPTHHEHKVAWARRILKP